LLEERQEPGAAELCELLRGMLSGAAGPEEALHLEQLKRAVYRLRIGNGSGRTLVLKRHPPAIAQTDRLVVERWLPALGLVDRCPRLLATAAQQEGRWVWHVYEDLGSETLADRREPRSLDAAVELVAELHTRGADHALLPEIRWHGRDHGVHFLTANLRDSIAALQALATVGRDVPRDFPAARARLLDRLHGLREDAPRRIRIMEDAGGPDTVLHGDLWPKNVFVTMAGDAPRAALIDWDHVSVGPFSYDVSTFLYQSPAEERPGILERYRAAVARAGWRLPPDEELNLLFHTAEIARCANCILWPAIALLNDGAEWGASGLVEIARWFEALRPPLTA
jgi:Ser/Thr protein kinase RdoA (MazF antagonist)